MSNWNFKIIQIIVFCLVIQSKSFAQSTNINSIDSIVVDYLIKKEQFTGFPKRDLSEINNKFELLKGHYYRNKLFDIHKNKTIITFYVFGANGSHNFRYLLASTDHAAYEIFGGNALETDLVKLFNLFQSLGKAVGTKNKIFCYEWLIENYDKSDSLIFSN